MYVPVRISIRKYIRDECVKVCPLLQNSSNIIVFHSLIIYILVCLGCCWLEWRTITEGEESASKNSPCWLHSKKPLGPRTISSLLNIQPRSLEMFGLIRLTWWRCCVVYKDP